MRLVIAAAGGAALGFWLLRRATYAKAHAVVDAEQIVTIRKPVDELYALFLRRDQWRLWMRPLIDAEVVGGRDNEILFSAPRELEGSVTFVELDHGRGTEMRMRVRHLPKVMPLSILRAGYRGLEPTTQLKEDLRRFKQLAECGEIANNESPSARKPRTPEIGSTVKRAIDVNTAVKNITIERGLQ